MQKHSNHLIHETSPYLLQHAHNPVNWYPWGGEAIRKAQKENKPILVSIGYAACHWCHVMERESFEDEATAAIMNENFINIKIDREERPDLDHIYMDAVQAMTGSGGWPLNVFLTPDAKPFYGGTYFPPGRAFNRPSWQETLHSVIQAFRERRHEIDVQAENLVDHIMKSNSFGIQRTKEDEIISPEKTKEIFNNLMKSADKEWGGFGKAPKFPQTFSIQYLLRYAHVYKNEEALSQALLSLDKMIEGGIYDQAGGGFARYSTDNEWLAPHFEKMLYDNALLVSVLCEAYQITNKERYREVIEETMDFVQREMLHPEGGFYSALDADSEGVEGKFYVWSLKEVEELLGEDAGLFCGFYDITEKGNWEGTNILRIKKPIELFANEKNISIDQLRKLLEKCKRKLLEQRDKRVRPLLDDKIILGWNALMNTACCKAFGATGKEEYRQLAIRNMEFLQSKFRRESYPVFFHTWKDDKAKFPAFLDDYAFLIEACRHLLEVTGDIAWLQTANGLTDFVAAQFDEESMVVTNNANESSIERPDFFYYTEKDQKDVIVRKKEMYDGAVPSGNSVMAKNLYHLCMLSQIGGWKGRSYGMISSLGNAIVKYPGSFGNWACLLLEMVAGTNEIALTGPGFEQLLPELLKEYVPHKIIIGSADGERNQIWPLLKKKQSTNPPSLWLCRNYTCHLPVFSVKELISLINRPPER
ncbi:MAG: thioredoxin domain-containing protein [Chitinophagaceae bacterium]|nr:thioredoxin domain-containing protein [Chitinophagaceae bacterium]